LEQCGCGFGGQGQVAELVDLCRHLHRSTYADTATMPRRGRQRLVTEEIGDLGSA
jgi:hypothetical protein